MNPAQDELKTVVRWISEQTRGMPLPRNRRARMALGSLDVAIEHQAGISVLAAECYWGPVYALLRCLFEAFVRGVWLARCASEIQLDSFELAGLRGKPFREMVDDVERALGHSRGVLSKLRTSSWAMFSEENSQHVYPVAETDQALRLATALGLLSATELAALSGQRDVALACKARVVHFAAPAATHREPAPH